MNGDNSGNQPMPNSYWVAELCPCPGRAEETNW